MEYMFDPPFQSICKHTQFIHTHAYTHKQNFVRSNFWVFTAFWIHRYALNRFLSQKMKTPITRAWICVSTINPSCTFPPVPSAKESARPLWLIFPGVCREHMYWVLNNTDQFMIWLLIKHECNMECNPFLPVFNSCIAWYTWDCQ